MHFSNPALLAASLLSRTISAYTHHPSGVSGLVDPHSHPLPFQFQPLFAANLILGRPSQQIAIPGGVLINEPITGGTVSGAAINGTVQGGFAHPAVYGNGGATRRQVPVIDVYGVSDDGESFYIHETGVGSLTAQVTRIELTIGGTQYTSLNEGYILASVNANANRTAVAVQGFRVVNILP